MRPTRYSVTNKGTPHHPSRLSRLVPSGRAGGRHAYLMELDALYADLIVRRWQQATGQKATLFDDGRTFTEITAEREET